MLSVFCISQPQTSASGVRIARKMYSLDVYVEPLCSTVKTSAISKFEKNFPKNGSNLRRNNPLKSNSSRVPFARTIINIIGAQGSTLAMVRSFALKSNSAVGMEPATATTKAIPPISKPCFRFPFWMKIEPKLLPASLLKMMTVQTIRNTSCSFSIIQPIGSESLRCRLL